MFGVIRSLLGRDECDIDSGRDEFTRAKSDLETISLLTINDFNRTQGKAVAAAVRLRCALSSGVALTMREKIEIVKLLNQLKVRAVSIGTNDSYSSFQILDSVSEDIKRYL